MKHTLLALLLSAGSAALTSCDKTKDTLEQPVIVVTAVDGNSGTAGEKLIFDVESSAANNINKLVVEEQAGSGARKIYREENVSPSKPRYTTAVDYVIPVASVKDEKITLTFTVTDDKGKTATETEVITATGSRPTVAIEAPVTEVSAGQTVSFTITLNSPGSDLEKFVWQESLNGLAKTLLDSTLAPGQRDYTTALNYTVPSQLTAGQYAVMVVTVRNREGNESQATKRFTVK